MFRKSTEVQSILFDRSAWTVSAAKKWLTDHGYKVPAVDSTADYHRFRQAPPFQFKAGTFRTISFGKASQGIKAVIAVPRKKNPFKRSRVPRKLVCLGQCLEIEFTDGTLYRPPRADLCASMSGRTLWIVRRGEKEKFTGSCKLYEAFHDFEAESKYIISIPDNISFKKSQKVKSVSYRSDKWTGKKTDYIHRFKKRPTAYSNDLKKPSIIKICGANIHIRPVGITG